MNQIDALINRCREAIAAELPVIFIESNEMGLLDELLRTGRIVPFWYNTTEGWERHPGDSAKPDNIFICNNSLTSSAVFTREWSRGYGPQLADPATVKDFLPSGCDFRYINEQVPGGVPFVLAVRNYGVDNGTADADADRAVAAFVAKRLAAQPGDGLRRCTLILQGPTVRLPRGIEPYVEVITVPALTDDEIRDVISRFAEAQNEKPYKTMLDRLTVDFRGMSPGKIVELLRRITLRFGSVFNIRADGEASALIRSAKEQMLIKEGLLRLVDTSGSLVAGLDNIKRWIGGRRRLILDSLEARRRGIRAPRGVLVSGIPGTGKSLLAKAAAQELGLPLLQFDMGSVMGGIIGQSEANMRRVLRLAEAMAPCVLWIDEIEKAFASASASGDSDGGLGKRLFGTFLTWMQEKTVPCFIFATANDISTLPPELLRRGRFDKKFYTFMPDKRECVSIFRGILGGKNDCNASLFTPEVLSEAFITDFVTYLGSRGKFVTGADIEGIVDDAKYLCYNESGGTCEVYDGPRFAKALRRAADDVQTYGQTDMHRIAECLLRLAENQFAPAAGTGLIDLAEVDVRAITMPPYSGPRNGYDELLYAAIEKELNYIRDKQK